jgi:hypothetical protein
MGLKFHPEVLPFFKDVGWLVLILVVFLLRFSHLFDPIFGFVFDRLIGNAQRNFSPPDPEPKSSLKTKSGSRLTTKQLRRGPTAADRHMKIFDCFAITLGLYGVADWLIIPAPYRLDDGQRWTALVAIFVVGTLAIFVGTKSWDGKVGYKKWSYWTSVAATALVTATLMRWMGSFRPGWILLTLFLSAVTFFYSFGMLRRIDRNKLDLERLQNQKQI